MDGALLVSRHLAGKHSETLPSGAKSNVGKPTFGPVRTGVGDQTRGVPAVNDSPVAVYSTTMIRWSTPR